MIYLDNSATTYPKPLSVRRKMAQALEQFGANPGRGGFKMSLQTAQAVYDVRQKAASFFGAAGPECISFQPSCTQSLNIVVKAWRPRACDRFGAQCGFAAAESHGGARCFVYRCARDARRQ